MAPEASVAAVVREASAEVAAHQAVAVADTDNPYYFLF